MHVLQDGETPTIEMIKEDLKYNPAGQSFLEMHIEFTHNAPFYIEYLLKRLEDAERPWWRRALHTLQRLIRYERKTNIANTNSFSVLKQTAT